MKKIYVISFLLTVALMAVCLLCGCTEKLVNDRQNENVQLNMKTTFTTSAGVDAIQTFVLTVAADDIDPTIRVELPLVEGKFQAEVMVPAGRNRVFTLLALDEGGAVLYRGVTVMDIFPSSDGEPPTVTIEMTPEVPMVRITPHYLDLPMGSSFSFDVEVFNLPDLDEISYEFSHLSTVADLDSVSRPASLDMSATFSYDISQQSTGQIAYMYVSMDDREGLIVNAQGYANLGTFHFSSYSVSGNENAIENIDLYLTVNSLTADSEGVAIQIPLEQVTVDQDAQVKLLRRTWELEFGGTGYDVGRDIVQTSDGGYVIAGQLGMLDAPSDAYLHKIDSLGVYKWGKQFRYPASGSNGFEAIAPTSDGGFIMTGYADVIGGTSSYDVYLAKADASGNLVWDTVFGDTLMDGGYDVIQASDGGYALCGNKGDSLLLIKTNASGVPLWQTTYMDTVIERHGYNAYGIVQAPDGGYLVAGAVMWYSQESEDAFLLKADASGNVTWGRDYPSASSSNFSDIIMVTTSSFVVIGSMGGDIYLAEITPWGDISWDKTYGGVNYSQGNSVVRTPDGGYFITGTTDNRDQSRAYDIYLLKTDASGDSTWVKTFGGYNYDDGYAGIATSDGGYIATGRVDNFGTTNNDIVIIKTDADGETYVREEIPQ